MPAQIVNSNNNFLGRLVEGFTGIEHDATLSGNGTTGSPLGCIKECTVHTDNTLSGDGSQASPLGCVLTETFTAVDHDGNLTGDGNTTPLGLSTSISAGELVMGNGQIKYTDAQGDIYVNATKVRNWDNMQPGMNDVKHNNTLSGDGTSTAQLGVVDNLKFAASLGSPDLSRASATIEPTRILSPSTMEYMKLQLTNEYGNTRNYTLIPNDLSAGYLYANGAGPIVSKSINSSKIWCYAFDSATTTFTTTKSADYLEVHLTTPYDYYGPEHFTANIDNRQFVLGSGEYCDLVWQNIEGTQRWCVKDSGYYSI